MKRLVIAAAFGLAVAVGYYLFATRLANSQGFVVTHSRLGKSSVTTVAPSDGQGLGRVLRNPRILNEEADRRWVEYCRPVETWDGLAWRYRYARAGCEYGRDRD